MDIHSNDLYAGLSGVQLEVDRFELGEGVTLSKTYAHLMAPFLMAFAPAPTGGHHPAPWSTAKGGFSFDIHVELFVPAGFKPTDWLDRSDIIWWIASLLRLISVPFMTVPVVSDTSFTTVPKSEREPHLQPHEITHRILKPSDESSRFLKEKDLIWVREKWVEGGKLMKANSKLNTAFRAFDSSMTQERASLSLISLWGGLEQLFSPSSAELKFRVSSLIASFLEPVGSARLALYKRILKLYDVRSTAAHTASSIETGPLLETYVLMRNALVKMIHENHVPTRDELEGALFKTNEGNEGL
jgi:hypothetical protein